jgi:hypothetical protein
VHFFAGYLKGAKARILLIVAFSDPGGRVRLVSNLFADAALERPGCTSCKTLPKIGVTLRETNCFLSCWNFFF